MFERDTVANFTHFDTTNASLVVKTGTGELVLCYIVKDFKPTVIYNALNKLICCAWGSILMYTT
jgi:hypothetical protein